MFEINFFGVLSFFLLFIDSSGGFTYKDGLKTTKKPV